MKKFWNLLAKHVQEDFHLRHYATVGLILAIAISVNYYVSLEENVLNALPPVAKLFGYFALYATLYYLAVFSYAKSINDLGLLRSKRFWLYSLFGLFILSFDSSAPYLNAMVRLLPSQMYLWSYKVLINFQSCLTVLVPLIIFHHQQDRNSSRVYGLMNTRFDARPYFLLIAFMTPLIIAASFHDSFLQQYPMYRNSRAHEYLGVPEWLLVAVYEFVYGLDFISVEYLFRGFFVIGMIAFLGRGSVLTMAVIYCSLHFGKPMGEAVSSVFGGYILGVVAYETRSIWGGVIVHVGIAWLMELTAFAQKL